MLTTNKNEIIESMCEDIEKASDSAIVWLADTFDVPLQADDSKHIRINSPHPIVSVRRKLVAESRFWGQGHNEQTVYIRVPVVNNGRYGKTVVVRGVLVPNDDHHRKAITVLNISPHSSRGKKVRNKHLPLLNGENAIKRLRGGKKVKSVKVQTTRNKKVYNVKFEEDL